MNIFLPADSIYASVQALDDKRLVKMVLETCQLLSNSMHLLGIKGPYGQCEIGEGRNISINKAYWSDASHTSRELLIFHELGHCVLNLEHDDSWITLNGVYIPKSIMNSYLFSEYLYDTFREYYMLELFRKSL